ncbi:crotonobetainyl-CoA:carnitine CoA-transferase CaiB-like acyl-CoA transferase [Pseudacidovorax intermedius]|uniref:Crotonobetainyl-CoA:carnitine CoA-transferase CaiB-like acyl-CoA transferase n=1 Tax=Pseudacidovorax intermedius TaxID=433924 RepID=A0A370F5B1_9BURK|nr:CoA transferase [Pseudacidovorax intermedius]RDI18605.1 crotonobetainyl-CoA:carnitine CoA-transferase CaiB-like acyl-CoA transferase [Pseudacidovorax intermedius]
MGASLQGIRVLDLTNVLAGPFACHQLAHMGADVIKVESRQGGDLARQLGADPELNRRHMGVSFLAQNPGKRSITVDFKKPAGKEVLRRLVRSADVLVENFRPGVMQRLGLGYESLLAENPRLVYCAISGFGQDGPLRDLPAYDQIIQGMSGTMSITGAPDNAPYRVGYPMADTIGGMTAAFAIAAALADRQRTGGTFIDVSMLEAVMATMGWVVSNHLIAGRAPQPMGNDNFTASPSGTFRTADGLLNIAANKQEQFEALCRVVERPDLPQDPRFCERQGRLQHRAELKTQLEAALAARTTEAWWPLLNQAGVPAGPVYTVGEALAHPQVAGRGMIGRFDDVPGVGRDIRVVRTGFKIDGQAPRVDTPPPTLGQHSTEILASLGYSAGEIAQLQDEQAI